MICRLLTLFKKYVFAVVTKKKSNYKTVICGGKKDIYFLKLSSQKKCFFPVSLQLKEQVILTQYWTFTWTYSTKTVETARPWQSDMQLELGTFCEGPALAVTLRVPHTHTEWHRYTEGNSSHSFQIRVQTWTSNWEEQMGAGGIIVFLFVFFCFCLFFPKEET